ncbi:RNA-binding protein 8A [Diplonema papillatum]|nr:RNA-binding protein 8A [Diplonema papillatum]WGM50005.1 Y14 [Diplonema papillatum]
MADFDTDNEWREKARSRHRGRGESSRHKRQGDEYESVPQDSMTPAAKSIEGWLIFVSGVHEEASEEDVYDLFRDFGEIRNLHLNLDRRTCYVKGYALIEYPDLKSAEKAIKALDGQTLNDQVLRVDWAFLKGPIGGKR